MTGWNSGGERSTGKGLTGIFISLTVHDIPSVVAKFLWLKQKSLLPSRFLKAIGYKPFLASERSAARLAH